MRHPGGADHAHVTDAAEAPERWHTVEECKYAKEAARGNGGTVKNRTAARHNAKQCVCYGVHQPSSAHPKNPPETAKPTSPNGYMEEHAEDGTANYAAMSEKPWGEKEWREFIQAKGQDPDAVTFGWGVTSNPNGGYWNKLNHVRAKTTAEDTGPAWPVIQPAADVTVVVLGGTPHTFRAYKLALKCSDTQIGFRHLQDGTTETFHDLEAMAVFVEVCRLYQPDKIQILGDFLDLPSQGRWAQEASFAQTTQDALNAGYRFIKSLRAACPNAMIEMVEGNHDKRMQTFIENNALAAFGLKRADMPDSWPQMSLPALLRLDELDVTYYDAYPAATVWDNDRTRNIHGTKANSKGSTTAQYLTDAPHLNTWAGHTHRTEITYRTVIGMRGMAIESYSANPGCLCKTDGTVPGVHSGVHSDGSSARIVEDWQQGFGMCYYNDAESWPFVYRIRNGSTILNGLLITATP